MTGCVTGNSEGLSRRLEAAIEVLVGPVTALLARLGNGAEVGCAREDGGYLLVVPVRFPDGVGEGRISGRIFRYRTGVRVDLVLRHNRVIALADGRPSDRSCFLNDFVASVTVGPDGTALPEKYVTHVVAGVRAALSAVDDHNRRHPQPWSRIRVAAS